MRKFLFAFALVMAAGCSGQNQSGDSPGRYQATATRSPSEGIVVVICDTRTGDSWASSDGQTWTPYKSPIKH